MQPLYLHPALGRNLKRQGLHHNITTYISWLPPPHSWDLHQMSLGALVAKILHSVICSVLDVCGKKDLGKCLRMNAASFWCSLKHLCLFQSHKVVTEASLQLWCIPGKRCSGCHKSLIDRPFQIPKLQSPVLFCSQINLKKLFYLWPNKPGSPYLPVISGVIEAVRGKDKLLSIWLKRHQLLGQAVWVACWVFCCLGFNSLY